MAVAFIYFQVKNALDFISEQVDLNKTFKAEIKSLTKRMDEFETGVEKIKGKVPFC